jgi:hypothetical protein
MWGAALFLITIVMVTPIGRALVDEYVCRIAASLAMPVPYAHAILMVMAFCALASMLLLRRRAPRRVEIRWVWYEIRGEPGENASGSRSARLSR